jgi:hypothetical protein
MTGTLHADHYTFFIISRSLMLRRRNVSDKLCRENQNTQFVFSNFFFPEICTVYEIMCKIIVHPSRPQMTTWRMRIACWIPKATDTHSYSEILIAFPLQQWLYERAWMLRYTYIVCRVEELCLQNGPMDWLRLDYINSLNGVIMGCANVLYFNNNNNNTLIHQILINIKVNYFKNQSVPRSKHSPTRL